MYYHVIFEDSDTRILEYDDSMKRFDTDTNFDTYEEAKEAVIEYLEDHIEGCQETLDVFKNEEEESEEQA